MRPRPWPEVDDVVGGADDALLVLDDHHGVAPVAQAEEGLREGLVVARVEPFRYADAYELAGAAGPLLVALDQRGVCAASGSACSSGSIDPSHVLLAMGMPRDLALASVRFSLGWASTADDVDDAISVVPTAVAQLRDPGKVA